MLLAAVVVVAMDGLVSENQFSENKDAQRTLCKPDHLQGPKKPRGNFKTLSRPWAMRGRPLTVPCCPSEDLALPWLKVSSCL